MINYIHNINIIFSYLFFYIIKGRFYYVSYFLNFYEFNTSYLFIIIFYQFDI